MRCRLYACARGYKLDIVHNLADAFDPGDPGDCGVDFPPPADDTREGNFARGY